MEMNNDIFTPDLPIPEPVEFEDAPIPAPVEEEKPAETPPSRRRRKADAPVLTIESGDEIETADCPRSCCLARDPQRLPHTAHPLRTAGRLLSRPTAAKRLPLWTTTVSASSFLSKK